MIINNNRYLIDQIRNDSIINSSIIGVNLVEDDQIDVIELSPIHFPVESTVEQQMQSSDLVLFLNPREIHAILFVPQQSLPAVSHFEGIEHPVLDAVSYPRYVQIDGHVDVLIDSQAG